MTLQSKPLRKNVHMEKQLCLTSDPGWDQFSRQGSEGDVGVRGWRWEGGMEMSQGSGCDVLQPHPSLLGVW